MEKLSKVTYDISASGQTANNLQAFLTSADDARSEFQAYDVRLTPGVENVVTFHFWDCAGNETTTELTLEVDSTTPALTDAGVSWPSEGTLIGGDFCSVIGNAGDPGATVIVTASDSTGNVTTLFGLVDRSGGYSINDVPVRAGQNTFSVSVTDSLGRTTTSTRTVQRASYTVDVNVGDLRRLETKVSGMIGKIGNAPDIQAVNINGVAAVVSPAPNQGWSDAQVAVDKEAALFRLKVVLTPVTGPAAEWNFTYEKPTFVRIDSYEETFLDEVGCEGGGFGDSYSLASWRDDTATTATDFFWASSFEPFTVETTFELPPDRFLVDEGWGSFWAYYFNGGGNILAPGLVASPSKPFSYSGVDDAGTPIDLGVDVYTMVVSLCGGGAQMASAMASAGGNSFSYDLVGYLSTWLRIPVIPSAYRDVDLSWSVSNTGDSGLAATAKYRRKVKSTLVLEMGGRPGEKIPVCLDLDLFTVDGEGFAMQGGSTLPASAADVVLGELEGTTDAQGRLWVMLPANARRVVTPKLDGDVLKRITAVEPTSGKQFAWADIKLTPILPKAAILVDLNRDGIISDGETTTEENPFRFWVNDDDDMAEIGGPDIPGALAPDHASPVVDGRRDLVDFFPIYLQIKELLELLPHGGPVKYKLKQAGSAARFVYTSLSPSHPFSYQRQVASTGFNDTFSQAPEVALSHQITASGVQLSSTFLDGIRDGGWGVLLIEGSAATGEPIVLAVERNDETVAEFKLHLRFTGVESMFRHLNLRDGLDAPDLPAPISKSGGAGVPSQMGVPPAFPDYLSNGKWLVFVHGYNVGASESRGWEAEAFKRFYWSGNRARYIGVDWLGNPDGKDIPADYHQAVMNALPTAGKLTEKINALSGAKTIVGHSMGCMVAAYAISDFALQVNQACLLNAAVASECFDGSSAEDITYMAYAPWTKTDDSSTPNYPRELWASDWHKRFQSGTDARQTLTWKDRFVNTLPIVNNFYSSTEDVLGVRPGTLAENVGNSTLGLFMPLAWQIQEKAKGNKVGLFGLNATGSDYGGWGFNIYDGMSASFPIWYVVREMDQGKRRYMTPAEIAARTDGWLNGSRWNPFFNSGWGDYVIGQPLQRHVDVSKRTGPDWIVDLYDPDLGAPIAANSLKRNQLLAEAIPALSPPAGNQPLTKLLPTRNFLMPLLYAAPTSWPREPDEFNNPQWFHSDLRAVAYLHTFKLFDKIISISNQ